MSFSIADWLGGIGSPQASAEETFFAEDRPSVVHVSREGATITAASGAVSFVEWKRLKSVEIEVHEDDRGETKLWWALLDNKRVVRVPQGAIGESSLMAKLLELPGFDGSALHAAIRSSKDTRFSCWRV